MTISATPKTVQELRIEIARSCEKSAAIWQGAADNGLAGAAEMAALIRADAARNWELAS